MSLSKEIVIESFKDGSTIEELAKRHKQKPKTIEGVIRKELVYLSKVLDGDSNIENRDVKPPKV